jgi:hypothetical protein
MKQFYTKPLAPSTPNENAGIPEPSPASQVDKLFGGTDGDRPQRVVKILKSSLIPAGGRPAPLSPLFPQWMLNRRK